MASTRIPFESKILILGYSGEGKTTLIERIIYDNSKHFKYIVCFSPTVKLMGKDYKCLGGFATDNCSRENAELFFNNQRELATKYNNGELKEPPHALFIFDDMLNSGINTYGKDKSFWAGKISVARHEYLSLIFSVQSLNSIISPPMLSQIKKMFIFYNGTDPMLIKKNLPPMLVNGRDMTPTQFKNLFARTFNEKYKALVYDKDKRVYNAVIKAKEAPPFIIKYSLTEEAHSSFF